MPQIQELARVMRAIFKPGDPLSYVCLALVACVLTVGAILIFGESQAVDGESITITDGIMAIALLLALGLVVLAIMRIFLRPPGL